ncbi:prepilin-type N-terminal cleavage/methylation domain-containing protein [Candidatus Woesebacteria bacterium]|nr:MAG: prepilin-type N-terminal cleavage/methylation domain-containing protein [Candidatus Woesebacteria bacterium]
MKDNNIKGFLIIETLIAIVIFSLVGLSLYASIGMLEVKTQKSKYDSGASLLVQEGVEIAHNAIIGDWDGYSDGLYHPAYDEDEDSWILVTGEENNLQARFTRSIKLISVCRHVDTGARIEDYELNNICSGEIDVNSRIIETSVKWIESGNEKAVTARLLSYRVPEK